MGIIVDVLFSLIRTWANWISGDPFLGLAITFGIIWAGWWILDNL